MLPTNQPHHAATLQAVTEAAQNTFDLLYGDRLSGLLAGLDSKTRTSCAPSLEKPSTPLLRQS